MDHESRISRVEAQEEMNQIDMERLHQAIDELRKLMLEKFEHTALDISELRKHTDLSISELRQHTDLSISELRQDTNRSISELRQHTDRSISELRQHTDRRFDEVNLQLREVNVQLRWLMGMWLTTIGMVAGLGGRILGVY